ncbi:hypothetical protein D1872_305790 [compost metagenome]
MIREKYGAVLSGEPHSIIMLKITPIRGVVRTAHGFREALAVIFIGVGTIVADHPDEWGCVDFPLTHL